MIAILAVGVVRVRVRPRPFPHSPPSTVTARGRTHGHTGVRPASVFLSETSALILVVEIGFLRHRSRRSPLSRRAKSRRTMRRRTAAAAAAAKEEGKSGEAEKRLERGRTDGRRGARGGQTYFLPSSALLPPAPSLGMHALSSPGFRRHK